MEKKDWKWLFGIAFIFAVFYFVPYESNLFNDSVISGVNLLNEYAKQHVLTCLVPALFIAGAIAVFIRKDKVLKFLGGDAKKYVSYSIASVSGAILAVCSCTILPIFAGIRKRGAGLGPAITFLFSGPAINIAAMFLTISVLGIQIGLARIISAVLLSFLVGLTMALIFREKTEKGHLLIQKEEGKDVSKWTMGGFFVLMVGLLIVNGLQIEKSTKNIIMIIMALAVAVLVITKFSKDVRNAWLNETWNFSKLILPLLFMGVFIAGFIMPLLPETIIQNLVGQNTVIGNLVASIFGAFMYFSTLTEIPILQALIAKDMHSGPALALLLAGPSLSLPNMLVVRGVLGNKKTLVYVGLVIIYSTIAGLIFGGIL
ncbi:permease [Candidatus Woesearchaeota archaeon]|nr:permease [Candidatus Woesearchaeota archaeon]